MCGACKRTTVHDPTLGHVRTMRQHLIVAQAVNAICGQFPGGPRITAMPDGWLMSGATGSTALCDTVRELWTTIIDGASCRKINCLIAAQKAYLAAPVNTELAAEVACLGLTLAEEHAHRDGGPC